MSDKCQCTLSQQLTWQSSHEWVGGDSGRRAGEIVIVVLWRAGPEAGECVVHESPQLPVATDVRGAEPLIGSDGRTPDIFLRDQGTLLCHLSRVWLAVAQTVTGTEQDGRGSLSSENLTQLLLGGWLVIRAAISEVQPLRESELRIQPIEQWPNQVRRAAGSRGINCAFRSPEHCLTLAARFGCCFVLDEVLSIGGVVGG